MTAPGDLLRAQRLAAERRLAQLDADIAELRRDRRSESADDEHDPEGTPLSDEWSRLAGLRAGAAEELLDVDAALARLTAGRYGVCENCGRTIPAARLEARPTASRCVDCAARASR
jgi:DnaK suppressor protein